MAVAVLSLSIAAWAGNGDCDTPKFGSFVPGTCTGTANLCAPIICAAEMSCKGCTADKVVNGGCFGPATASSACNDVPTAYNPTGLIATSVTCFCTTMEPGGDVTSYDVDQMACKPTSNNPKIYTTSNGSGYMCDE